MIIRKWIINTFFRKNPIDLLDSHPFFLDMDKLITIKIDKIHAPTKTKERMIREFLNILFSTYKNKFKDFILQHQTITTNAMKVLMHDCWKKYKETSITEGIPRIFLEKFDDVYKDTFDDMMHELENITEDALYESEFDRYSAVLSIMSYSMRTLYTDVKTSIHSLNGELEAILKGSKFDNMI